MNERFARPRVTRSDAERGVIGGMLADAIYAHAGWRDAAASSSAPGNS